MNEIRRIAKQFNDLYNGSPWIAVNFDDTLKSITSAEAAEKPGRDMNSIWEIVNHVISWREVVIKRLQGNKIPTPDHNYFVPVADKSKKGWHNTLQRFERSQKQWLTFIKKYKAADLIKPSGSGTFSNYDIVIGILEHDAYHLGQVRVVRRLIKN